MHQKLKTVAKVLLRIKYQNLNIPIKNQWVKALPNSWNTA